MIPAIHLRSGLSGWRLGVQALCCIVLAASNADLRAQAAAAAQPPAQTAAQLADAHMVPPEPDKRQKREAENAYLSGAKKLERDDLEGAEHDFVRALNLDPGNRNYAIAISITRQHRLTQLVQGAYKARLNGDASKSESLLAQARALDPTNPMVLEHSEPVVAPGAPVVAHSDAVVAANVPAPQPPPSPVSPAPVAIVPVNSPVTPPSATTPIADRARMIANAEALQPWKIQPPSLAGAIHLEPAGGVQSFTLRGNSANVIRDVAKTYGIRIVADDSLERKDLHFDIENVTYERALAILMGMAHAFAVPLDTTTILIARDSTENRQRLEHQLEETIQVPGSTPDQLNEIVNVVRTMFDVKQATVQPGSGTIVVRAPEDVLTPLNRTIQGLIESTGEVMIEVKMYEISSSHASNVGVTLPNQFSVFNIDQVANQIVSANQTLVQQGIAQGLIGATDSNLTIALKLIASGLVSNSLASNLIGVFGSGLFATGISGSTATTINLGLNSSDSRALDDVQMRIGDRQEGVFREGSRYPITTSTYSSGLSTAASSLANTTINGVNVGNLLSKFAGGTSATIPQVSYEDLGVTLKATPIILRMGRVNLKLDLKIQALGGGSANGIPVLQSRQFASVLTLNDGESALMVSSVSKTETAAMTGIPGLSELPGFQIPTNKETQKESSQLVVVVTPHVVRRLTDQLAGARIAVRSALEN